MSTPAEHHMKSGAEETLSPVKRALLEVRDLRRRLAAYEAEREEPIAIVGMACRLPGGIDDAESFWALLHEGRSAVGTVPAERWDNDAIFAADPDAPGKTYTAAGAFVSDVDQFDPYFFGIPPREAASMDPQQRLLLEVAWEALENAGADAAKLDGTPAGVFVGIGCNDYAILQARTGTLEDIDAYHASGVAHSVAAGRLAYSLGFQGPCVAIDTACSSSLVAVHQACASLRQRECRLALAGGANLILVPDYTVNFCRSRMLSPSGACHTFDAKADGYVRGEGVALVALKRLTDARADGDRILAVIKGSAINQDGRSTGLTVPNGPAQEAVIRQALERAGAAAHEVQYVEAHGTGTPLGDPIEVQALASALGAGRRSDEPLLIGSVKTNLGHLEATAGIAGLIKVVLALQHGEIPAHLHFDTPNPHIDWSALPVEVTTRARPWRSGPRLAGVSSFGFSGTNAHVVLEQAPADERSFDAGDFTWTVLPLSAKDEQALRASAARYAEYLRAHPAVRLVDVAHTAAAGRAHFAHRLAVIAADSASAAAELERFARGEQSACILGDGDVSAAIEPVFLFTGQGSQYAGMARELYDTEPLFRDALDEAARVLDSELPQPLLRVIFDDAGDLLDQTQFTQPALFAIEVALARLWRSWGVEPSFVIGHSVGEYAAACIAGVFTLEEGARLIAARARLMQALPPGGAMTAIQGDDEGLAARLVQEHSAHVSIAARNAPGSVVVTGEADVVAKISQNLAARGLQVQPLNVSHAFHSPLMTPMLQEFQRVASATTHRAPQIGWISNLTGDVVDWTQWSDRMGEYWRRHVRETVRFQDCVEAASKQRVSAFLEVGPHPVLCGLGRATLGDDQASWHFSLKRGQDSRQQLLSCLAQLYVRGARIEWTAVGGHAPRQKLALPTYPFQRQRYWIENKGNQLAAVEAEPARWERAVQAGRRQANFTPFDLAIESFPAKWSSLGSLAQAYIIKALRDLGAFRRAGESRTAQEIVESSGVLPVYVKLVDRWLTRLSGAGLLLKHDKSFVAQAPLPEVALEPLRATARTCFANYPAMFAYVELCGAKLVDVLTGKESALETLFPDGSNTITDGLYQTSVVARYFNEVVRAVVQAATSSHAPVSLLEIGAGTGGTTAILLPELSAARTKYVFTDLGRLFLVQGRQKFQAYDFVEYELLDIERPPAEQGFAEHGFDLVVAANVLHATRDLAATLRHARSLLASGGVLVMLETTDHPIWLDMSTGLIEGWQIFEDPMRDSHPLLNVSQWAELLKDCGFEMSEAFPAHASPMQLLGQHVIVARAPQTATTHSRVAPKTASARMSHGANGAIREEEAGALRERIAAATSNIRHEILEDVVREEVCFVLGVDRAHQPTHTQRLKEFGVDSLMAVELRNRLARRLALQRKLTATLIFDYPTVQAIAQYLAEDMLGYATEAAGAAAVRRPESSLTSEAIAGMDDAAAEALLLEKLKSL
jgi:acyl transferase domain-containing protein/SAM-dependent methyltransferase/acyl carrier protein